MSTPILMVCARCGRRRADVTTDATTATRRREWARPLGGWRQADGVHYCFRCARAWDVARAAERRRSDP